MRTVYVGQTKLYSYGGRYFAINEESADAIMNAEWALGVLGKPAVTYPNGRDSHEVAGEVLDSSEDRLIDHMRVVA